MKCADSKGYIKLYRKISDWALYGDDGCVKLLIHLLAHANRKRAYVHNSWIEQGQVMLGERDTAEKLRWSREKLRRKLVLLTEEGTITCNKSPNGTIITIIKWSDYQNEEWSQNETTNETTNDTTHKTTGKTTDETLTRSIDTSEKNRKSSSSSSMWEGEYWDGL